ncbi:DUF4440 domain-containing protein [Marivirga sp. S37H4]|uniref:DUF4440 domain-containing protein n=1 Tax=Marivirga aurantiaca TaxID=2802615 RepID=A0A934WYQ0_9BACT|nr:DUF4440 domain-containing protein [Marivirga aurantiaca]MBK6265235.1 DUF4440 domain-containing protein [Marivirga aurantiaca]
MRYLILVLCICSCYTAHSQKYVGDKDEIEAILLKSKAFSQFYVAGDFESLANSYTVDGKIMPPGTDIIEGREAIKQRWLLPENVKILHHKAVPVEIVIMDDTAYDAGYYEGTTQKADGSTVSWSGKYLIIWKKEAGEWKMYYDIWNNRKQ